MTTKRVKLTFPPDTLLRPVFSEWVQGFPAITVTVIGAHADRNGSSGWMIVDVSGSISDIDVALVWIRQKVKVDSAEEIFPQIGSISNLSS